MSVYIPPVYNNIIFEFDKGGYTPPNFNNINFVFGETKVKFADIVNSINGMEFQTDYLKGCDTQVIGYSNGDIQVLKSDCVYGGIRDLYFMTEGALFPDLPCFIRPTIQDTRDLNVKTKGWYREREYRALEIIKGIAHATFDLNNYIKPTHFRNLPEYVIPTNRSFNDLQNLIKSIHISESSVLSSTIKAQDSGTDMLSEIVKPIWKTNDDLKFLIKSYSDGTDYIRQIVKGFTSTEIDLPSYLKSTKNDNLELSSYLSVLLRNYTSIDCLIKSYSEIQITDLNTVLKGKATDFIDLFGYTKKTLSGTLELAQYLKSNRCDNALLLSELFCWDFFDLSQRITAFHTYDLSCQISLNYFKDLYLQVTSVEPFDLINSIRGLAIKDLPIVYTYYEPEWDLKGFINGVEPVDLKVYIKSMKGLNSVSDLLGKTTNFNVELLYSNIVAMQYYDLGAYLNSTRDTADLNVKIFPKSVYVRHLINVPFLENRDLYATVNYLCAHSDYSDLFSSIEVQHSKDLLLRIYGSDGRNIIDLSCSINSYDFIIQDEVTVKYFSTPVADSSVELVYSYRNEASYVFDVCTLRYGYNSFFTGQKNLYCSVYGQYTYSDLGCTVIPYQNPHINATVAPSTVITLQLKNNIEAFRRYVGITLNEFAFEYYYFSGNKRAYRVNKDDHWVIKVEGYNLLEEGRSTIKSKVLRKYIFNLKNYSTIDAAIRDMIDRVTLPRSSDLPVYLNAIESIYDSNTMLDLKVQIKGRYIYKTLKKLQLVIKALQSTGTDLSCNINGYIDYQTIDLGSFIIGLLEAEIESDGVVDFNFGPGEIEIYPDSADFIFRNENI